MKCLPWLKFFLLIVLLGGCAANAGADVADAVIEPDNQVEEIAPSRPSSDSRHASLWARKGGAGSFYASRIARNVGDVLTVIVDETANGTEDIWWIDEGKDYPRLWWELIPEN